MFFTAAMGSPSCFRGEHISTDRADHGGDEAQAEGGGPGGPPPRRGSVALGDAVHTALDRGRRVRGPRLYRDRAVPDLVRRMVTVDPDVDAVQVDAVPVGHIGIFGPFRAVARLVQTERGVRV